MLDGTFHIVRLIGAGGMGEVYEARHSRLAGRYAVKVLHPEIRQHEEVLRRFQREAQVTSALRHPGIVQVIDFNIAANGAPYLVMEYLDGHDLGQIIAQQGPLGLTRTMGIATQLASALAAAHRSGVVHRDLKPQNVFLVPGEEEEPERVKILDFGISKIRSMSAKLTGSATVLGTPQYMAPEQAEGRDEVDAAADQFSLAAIVYEMLTGRCPFAGETVASIVYQIVYIEPVRITRLRPDLSEALAAVVMRALSKKKADRFPSAWEFVRRLQDAAAPDMERGGGDDAKTPLVEASAQVAVPAAKQPASGRTLAFGSLRPPAAPAVSTTTFRRATGERVRLPAVLERPRAKKAIGAAGLSLLVGGAVAFYVVNASQQSSSVVGSASAVASSAATGSSTPCLMTIGSTPWSHLWLDGKDTHRQTPIVSLAVPCGAHRISLKRPDLGIDFSGDVVVKPDQEFKRSYQIGFPD